jgi:hypothetical protein
MGSGMTQLAKWLLNQGLNRWLLVFVLFFTLSLKIIIIFFWGTSFLFKISML